MTLWTLFSNINKIKLFLGIFYLKITFYSINFSKKCYKYEIFNKVIKFILKIVLKFNIHCDSLRY